MRDLLEDLDAMLSHPDPVKRAQIQMKKPLPKRFYTEVTVEPSADGFQIKLDGKTLKTPARATLLLETAALGELVANEWRSQKDVINPDTMPITRLVNTAQDAVALDPSATREDIVNFSGTDLVCYRADSPAELVARQSAGWDPVLAFAHEAFGASFVLAQGVIHQEQPASAIAAIRKAVETVASPAALSALHVMTTLTGSALIALAAAHGHLSIDQAWTAAHLDEDWTIEHWGEDEEAMARRAWRRTEFDAAAATFFAVAGRK